MDWTKAKSILIVALIVTNLVLIGTYFFQTNDLNSNASEMKDVTIKLLEQQNIYIDADIIPKDHKRMAKLTVQYDKMNEDVINGQLAGQKALPEEKRTEEDYLAATKTFLEDCGLMTDNVTYSSMERAGDDVLLNYKNCIDGIAIEKSYIIFTIRDGKIVDFKRFWLNPTEISNNEKNVIPANAALIKFMSENTEGIRIDVEDVSMVYWLDTSSFDAESPVTDTAFPAWKITYNHGKVKYILAWEQ
jgi:regulatory protein YycI of two-component signal transduction system YycFG